MSSRNAADILLDVLIGWDVEVVFGLPGIGLSGIMEGLRKRQDRIRLPGPDQTLRFAEALAKGQPARGKIVKTVLESRIKEMV